MAGDFHHACRRRVKDRADECPLSRLSDANDERPEPALLALTKAVP